MSERLITDAAWTEINRLLRENELKWEGVGATVQGPALPGPDLLTSPFTSFLEAQKDGTIARGLGKILLKHGERGA